MTPSSPTTAPASTPASLLPAAIALGFWGAMVVWTTWFVTHLPWTGLAAPVQTAITVVAWVLTMVWTGREAASVGRAARLGAASGLVTSLIGLLLLGAKLGGEETDTRPSGLLIGGAFLLMGTLIGVGGMAAGRGLLPASKRTRDWHSCLSLAVVCIAAPLLFVGGLVTSTNSGMAVPDWPATYGMNMFLYPLGTAPTDVFLEHSHRLFGAFLGLATLTLMIMTWTTGRSKGIKVFATLIFLAVLAQGIVGGVRVQQGHVDPALDNRWNSMFHGIGAQLIFAALVAFWTASTPLWKEASPDADAPAARRLRIFAAAAMHTTIIQMIFGAMYRHLQSSHALWSHIGFSLLVVVLAALTGFMAIRQRENVREGWDASGALKRRIATTGTLLVGVVLFQFLMGWVVFGFSRHDIRTDSPGLAVLRTLHQANGALMLATCTVLMVLSRRLAPRRK
jgi:cytochrome c oxidase assembly protein subunit 15